MLSNGKVSSDIKEWKDGWKIRKETYEEEKRIYDEKINRIVTGILECMNKEEILLSDVDVILSKIKAATTRQVEAALRKSVVKGLV